MNSICRFIPPIRTHENIQTINFVYESRPETIVHPLYSSVYRMHIMTDGECEITIGDITRRVRRGDVFFIFPSVPYTFTPYAGSRYMYISYIGIRATAEMERLGINRTNFVFPEMGELLPLWLESINMKSDVSDLASEGVLLCSLAKLSAVLISRSKKDGLSPSEQNCLLIKQYIEENFADPELSCEKISIYFSYSKKYVSRIFCKCFGLGIAEYINTVRISAACDLIEKGATNVSEISQRVGFRDPLYFSKVFSKRVGRSPKKHMLEKRNKQ